MQKISTPQNASVSYCFIFASEPVAARIISVWATDSDHRYADSRGLRAAGALLARAALRSLLATMTTTHAWDFAHDCRGKLFVTSLKGEPGPGVSLSHTRGAVAVAIALSNRVGIDLERHRPRDYRSIAQYAFGSREQARIDGEGLQGFYRVWTLREAIAKATGQGLSLVTDTLDRVHCGPTMGTWTARCDGDDWLLHHSCPATDLSLAIAVAAPEKHDMTSVSAEELARPRNAV